MQRKLTLSDAHLTLPTFVALFLASVVYMMYCVGAAIHHVNVLDAIESYLHCKGALTIGARNPSLR